MSDQQQQDHEFAGWALTPAAYEATREKIAKLNARATKRGFTGHVDIQAERVERTYRDENTGLDITEVVYDTTITGEAPCYEGWRFLATLEWISEDGLIVNTVPGVESVNREGLREGWCDHCKSQRHRKNTYLVQHTDTGEQRQVGSTCLKDFLGWSAMPSFLSAQKVEEELDAAMGGFPKDFTVETVLACAWAVVKRNGFVPASTCGYGETPTRDIVNLLLDPPPLSVDAQDAAREHAPYIEEARGMATKLRDWLLSDEFDGTSEYVLNMKAVAGAGHVGSRQFGLLASAPQAWAKAQERSLVKQRENTDDIRNEWYGNVGDKIEVRVRVRSVRWSENAYGVSTIYKMVSEDGYPFTWFASRDALGEEPSDELVTIRGTIKKHSEWQDRKETILTRCKLVD